MHNDKPEGDTGGRCALTGQLGAIDAQIAQAKNYAAKAPTLRMRKDALSILPELRRQRAKVKNHAGV